MQLWALTSNHDFLELQGNILKYFYSKNGWADLYVSTSSQLTCVTLMENNYT